MEKNKQLVVPIAVISPIDAARLIRELNSLDEYLRQVEIRSGNAPQEVPRYSRLLDEVVQANGYNLLADADRSLLVSQLEELHEHAPVLHISFSADPPGSYIQKIVSWLRQNIDGRILVQVGLQPNIGAGCVVRTPNKQFDFSLRSYFDSKHEFFMKKLHEVVAPEMLTPVAAVVEPTQTEVAAAENQQIEVKVEPETKE